MTAKQVNRTAFAYNTWLKVAWCVWNLVKLQYKEFVTKPGSNGRKMALLVKEEDKEELEEAAEGLAAAEVIHWSSCRSVFFVRTCGIFTLKAEQ